MQRSGNRSMSGKWSDIAIRDLKASFEAGEDPRRTIARLNERIVDCQRAGLDMPPCYLRFSRTLAAECVALGQAR